MNIQQLATALAVNTKTIERWVARGLPRTAVGRTFDYDLPTVRSWRAAGGADRPSDKAVVKDRPVNVAPPKVDRMRLPVVPPLDVPEDKTARQRLIEQKLKEAQELVAELTRPLSATEKLVEVAKTPGQRLAEANVLLRKAEVLHGEALQLGAIRGNSRWGGG